MKTNDVPALGKGEVESSILSHSTISLNVSSASCEGSRIDPQPDAEPRQNTHGNAVQNPCDSFFERSGESRREGLLAAASVAAIAGYYDEAAALLDAAGA